MTEMGKDYLARVPFTRMLKDDQDGTMRIADKLTTGCSDHA
jgi:hypothetical protein